MATFFAFSGITVLNMEVMMLLKILVTLFSTALFIQSGFDKVFDWAGNRAYIIGVFEKTFLRPVAALLFPMITLLEVAAGLLSLAGVVLLLISGTETVAVMGLLLGAVSILSLFTGMRIAKDYGGAAGITPYFVFFVVALSLFVL